jgi:hypothetical protein
VPRIRDQGLCMGPTPASQRPLGGYPSMLLCRTGREKQVQERSMRWHAGTAGPTCCSSCKHATKPVLPAAACSHPPESVRNQIRHTLRHCCLGSTTFATVKTQGWKAEYSMVVTGLERLGVHHHAGQLAQYSQHPQNIVHFQPNTLHDLPI